MRWVTGVKFSWTREDFWSEIVDTKKKETCYFNEYSLFVFACASLCFGLFWFGFHLCSSIDWFLDVIIMISYKKMWSHVPTRWLKREEGKHFSTKKWRKKKETQNKTKNPAYTRTCASPALFHPPVLIIFNRKLLMWSHLTNLIDFVLLTVSVFSGKTNWQSQQRINYNICA